MAYLFVHFTGESENAEQVYFAVSRDGLHFTDLNGTQPVMVSDIGEKGVRDPFIIRTEENEFVIIGTDLRIASGKGWGPAQFEGSRSLVVFKSKDLVNWSKAKLVEVGIPTAGCVWAPEAVYSKERDEYLVFWASMVREPGEEGAKQRIYASWTKDFENYSKPFKYIEHDNHVIDTDIIYADGRYYRFSKDETTKVIKMDHAAKLEGPYTDLPCPTLDNLYGVEGPEAYYISEMGTWCLIVDRFATNGGYLPVICEDLEKGDLRVLEDSEFDMGLRKKRHGGVITITDEEYDRLVKAYGIEK